MDIIFRSLCISGHCGNRKKAKKSLNIQPGWQVQEHTNLTSSAYSLPTEILEEIFRIARPSIPHQRRGYAVILSHVTRRWRNIALCTACLWTDIYIWLGARDACLASYLERSSNHRLDVKVDLNAHCGDGFLDDLRHQLQIIISQIARLRSLTVDVARIDHLDYVLQSLHGLHVPCLEALHMRFRGGSNYSLRRHVLTGGAPVLSSLTFRGISGRSCTLPLAAVTYLHLGVTRPKLDPGQLRDMLTSMPLLRQLFLAVDGVSFWRPGANWPTIHLPSLISLTIAYTTRHPEYNSQLYKQLTTPNLECFAIEGLIVEPPVADRHGDINSVILDDAFINLPPDVKYPRLRSLAVATCDMDSEIFVYLCKALPTVNRVSFWHQQRNTTLPLLEDFEDIPLLWPDLHHITLLPLTFRNIDALRNVVSSRIRSGHPLHSIGHQNGLHDDSMLLDEDLEWLREHVKLEVDEHQPSE
jgi:hypothetical protein